MLFLFFAGTFGSLFYFLYDEGTDFEHEKILHHLDIMSAGVQSILGGNEKFFLTVVRDFPEASPLKQKCLTYLSVHQEIVSIRRSKDDGMIQWSVPQDSSDEMLAQAAAGSPLFSYADSSHSVFYTKPFRFNERYYFEAKFLMPHYAGAAETCMVFYSAEKLLREVLLRHPMENYEVTVFSGWGQEIASTGFSNAPSSIRLQQGVPGYGQLLTIDITEPAYVFWTPAMIVMAALCGLLSAAVLAVTIVLRRDLAKLRTTQSSLRSSEERFRAIFENSADAMRLVDRFGRTVMVNSAYCDLVKTSREELLREYNEGDDNIEGALRIELGISDSIRCRDAESAGIAGRQAPGGEEIPVETRHSFINIGRGEKLLLEHLSGHERKEKI